MKLIVGLGNPGAQYNFTRHNLGFLALDFYAKAHHLNWRSSSKFHSEIIQLDQALLIKPQDFYNQTGLNVRKIIDFYKASPQDLLVILDDFNLPFGTIRERQKGSAGGNNGLKSLINHLETPEFRRLRFGTDHPRRKLIGDTDFVITTFSPEEKLRLPQYLDQIASVIDQFVSS